MLTPDASVASDRRAHHRRHHRTAEFGFDLDGDLVGEAVLAELDRRVPAAVELGGHQEVLDVVGIRRDERRDTR